MIVDASLKMLYRRAALFSVASLALVPALLHKAGGRFSLSTASAAPSSRSTPPPPSFSYITSDKAKMIDAHLMDQNKGGFSLDQLMELAGLAVCHAAHDYITTELPPSANARPRILVLCGPGNNGGDGLVAARHLHHMGYDIEIVYPKQSAGPLFAGLVAQCKQLGISVKTEADLESWKSFDLVMDGLFGFSFTGEPREPFFSLLKALEAPSVPPILSIDIPSGWDVNHVSGVVPGKDGPPKVYIKPRAVISLTAPKTCMMGYEGTHYIGGRFVPPSLAAEWGLVIVPYTGTEQVVKVSTGAQLPEASCAEAGTANGGKMVLTIVTVNSLLAAETLADVLVSDRLAACVNILPGAKSTYMWEGSLHHDEEVLMLVKSRADDASVRRLTLAIKQMHSYDTPEVIQVPVVGGLGKYIDWVLDGTESGEKK